jgi:E3 ubiquitin-protein ligase HUWE1
MLIAVLVDCQRQRELEEKAAKEKAERERKEQEAKSKEQDVEMKDGKQEEGEEAKKDLQQLVDELKGAQEEKKLYINSIQILQLLTDFIASYAVCSHVMFRHHFSKNVDAKGYKDIIGFTLDQLLPHSHFVHNADQQNTSVAATKLLAALCARPEGRRKVITEAIDKLSMHLPQLKTFREYPDSVHSLADFIYLLLTSRSSGAISTDMAKIMLEMKAIDVLLNGIKIADLSHPKSAELMAALVKPLELLSKSSLTAPSASTKNATEPSSSSLPAAESGPVGEVVLDTFNLRNVDEMEEENDEDVEDEDEDGEDDEEGEVMGEQDADLMEAEEEDDLEDDEDSEQYQEQDLTEELNPPLEFDPNPPADNLQIVFDDQESSVANTALSFLQEFLPSFSNSSSAPRFTLLRSSNTINIQGETENTFQFVAENVDPTSFRQLERNFFGRASRASGSSSPHINRWTDDGGKPTQSMVSYALNYEPLITETLTKLTLEDVEKEKQAKAEQKKESEKKESEKPVDSKPSDSPSSSEPSTSIQFPSSESTVAASVPSISSSAATTAEAPKAETPIVVPSVAPSRAEIPAPASASSTPQATTPVAPESSSLEASLQSILSSSSLTAPLPTPPPSATTSTLPSATASTLPVTEAPTLPTASTQPPSSPKLPASTVPSSSTLPSSSTSSSSAESTTAPSTSTSNSIDPTFLEALPAELRDEVLASQIGQSAPTSVSTSTLNPDFLAALPPDIQAEVLAQERQEQERVARQAAADTSADTSLAQEMDNASFIATLPPDLREEILLTQDETFISTLTPQLAAEAHAIRERAYRSRFWGRREFGIAREGVPQLHPPGDVDTLGKPKALFDQKGRPIVDNESLAYLIRLLYMQQSLGRGVLHRLFLHLCSYETTRIHFVSKLITLLAAYIEQRTEAEMSAAGLHTNSVSDAIIHLKSLPPAKSQHSMLGFQPGITYSMIPSPNSYPPTLVTRRVLEILALLIKSNPRVAEFMIQSQSTQELDKSNPPFIKEIKMKDRGEEYYPVSVLLNLLGVHEFFSNPTHLEYLLNTLNTVAKMFPQKKEKEESASSSTTVPSGSESTAPSTTATETEATSSPSTAPSSTTPQSPVPTKKEEEEKATEPKVPPCPKLSEGELENLANVLTIVSPTPTEQSFKTVCFIIQHLAVESSNREILLAKLLLAAQKTAELVTVEFNNLRKHLEKSSLHPSAVLTMLSSSSSLEINLLRILKALTELTEAEFLSGKLKLEPLWESFETALNILGNKNLPEHAGAAISTLSPLLPIIESFFVVNASALSGAMAQTDLKSSVTQSPLLTRFIRFSERYRKLLNDLIKQNPALLGESFSVLLKVPQLIDFENKRSYFKAQIQKQKTETEYYGEIRLNVRRAHLIEDSFYQLRARSPEEMRGRLVVHFSGEEGIDAGGVSREWYNILAKQMFNPDYCLFIPTADSAYQPNKNSSINVDHLAYFKFIGRVFGKALHDGQLLDAHFTRSFYKHILGLAVNYHDMEAIDPEYYKNLKWLVDNDVSELDLTFALQQEEFGVVKQVELKPGGN